MSAITYIYKKTSDFTVHHTLIWYLLEYKNNILSAPSRRKKKKKTKKRKALY